MLKKFTELLPIGSITLIITGFVYNSFYYSKFGINIFDFIDIGELIPLIIPSAIMIFGIVGLFSFTYLIYFQEFVAVNIVRIPLSRFFFYSPKGKLNFRFYTIVIIAVTIILVNNIFNLIKGDKDIVTFLFILVLVIYASPIIIRSIIETLSFKKERTEIAAMTFGVYFFIINVLISICISQHDYYTRMHRKSNETISFLSEGNIQFKSDSLHIFVGKTKKYYFTFDKGNNTTTIYKEEKVADLKIVIEQDK